jgi:hypothetical protein
MKNVEGRVTGWSAKEKVDSTIQTSYIDVIESIFDTRSFGRGLVLKKRRQNIKTEIVVCLTNLGRKSKFLRSKERQAVGFCL